MLEKISDYQFMMIANMIENLNKDESFAREKGYLDLTNDIANEKNETERHAKMISWINGYFGKKKEKMKLFLDFAINTENINNNVYRKNFDAIKNNCMIKDYFLFVVISVMKSTDENNNEYLIIFLRDIEREKDISIRTDKNNFTLIFKALNKIDNQAYYLDHHIFVYSKRRENILLEKMRTFKKLIDGELGEEVK